MYLTDLVHANDQLPSTFPSPSNPNISLISFAKRQRFSDIVSTILKHRAKPYDFAEHDPTKTFIEQQLRLASTKDEQWFWDKSAEWQQVELTHADIKKSLEQAGF